MITKELINPQSIVVIGGSNDIKKPGGKILKNLIDGQYKGKLYVINQREDKVQGIKSYRSAFDLPQVDLAIFAIKARFILGTVHILLKEKTTKAFIILSAGFSELNGEGRKLEKQITKVITEAKGSLIGPNCIGVLNEYYHGVFTLPIPKLDRKGCDFISGSGAVACFILEAGIPKGLTFSSVYSVGNSAQIGVEDLLKYLDETFNPETSSKVKLLYIEDIAQPKMLLEHASSLVRKGCKIAAIKAGASEAGSRAAFSHTGALANSDIAVSALFKKAGIVRCYGREDLINIASVFMHQDLKGKNIAIISHAGGPAVMLTDTLSNNGLNVPLIEGHEAQNLLDQLFPGSSVSNPIDFLATGNAEQLGIIIDYVEQKFEHIDAMIVIFGTPGLFKIFDVYKILDEKMKICKKPIYPVLPSIGTAHEEIKEFLIKGRINFTDEMVLGESLARVYNTPKPVRSIHENVPLINKLVIRTIIEQAQHNNLSPVEVQKILDAIGISRINEKITTKKEEAFEFANEHGYPLVMKVVGPIHKSDVHGVVLNIVDQQTIAKEFERLIKIENATAISISSMVVGTEVFIGAKKEGEFGHLIMCGLGGIFVEILKDVSVELAPINMDVAVDMIRKLKGYKIIKGARKQEPVNEMLFAENIVRISELIRLFPEISELDINPLFGSKNSLIAVDARIRITKKK